MKLKYTEKRVDLGKYDYTVIIPDNIDSLVNTEYGMDGDRRALEALLISMVMLIENRNLIIYFPLWKNKLAKGIYRSNKTEHRYQNFDVVFLSHTLQFPIHDWKELRAKLKRVKGKPHIKEINLILSDKTIENICMKYEKTNNYYKKRDLLDRYFRFDTHFLVGGSYSFSKTYTVIKEFLKKNLEYEFITSIFLYWRILPQVCSPKNDWLEEIEIGFYDRRYEKDRSNFEKDFYEKDNADYC
jgi:hypothetical protein